jgi:hypothetical protein
MHSEKASQQQPRRVRQVLALSAFELMGRFSSSRIAATISFCVISQIAIGCRHLSILLV